MLDATLGTRCVQRLMLEVAGDELVLATAAGELKPQALAFYGSGRASRLVELAEQDGWAATPSLYLGYRGANADAQRLYTTCRLSLDEYVRRWAGEDRERIGAYPYETVRAELWPWLQERGYASAEDAAGLDEFLDGMGRRDAHLRPRVEITRRWAWADAERLDDRGTLADDLRTAITLRELDGLSYEEIAQAMDCPVGTVRSRIFRAREAIDNRLKPLLDNK